MAILLPLLLTIALLCVDFGRFAHTLIAVNNAARAGAAYASMHPFTPVSRGVWEGNTQLAVKNELEASGWFDARICIYRHRSQSTMGTADAVSVLKCGTCSRH